MLRPAGSPWLLHDLRILTASRAFSQSASCQDVAVSTLFPDFGQTSTSEMDSAVPITGRYEIESIPAILRERRGLKRHRQAGFLPGMLSLQNDKNALLLLDAKQINRLVSQHGYFGILSRLFNLTITGDEGQSMQLPVIAKNVHRTATSYALENIVFMHCPPERLVKVNVPVRLTGEDVSPGVKKGGFVSLTRWFVKCLCQGNCIPSQFLIDVSQMDMADKYYLDILEELPHGVALNERNVRDPICRMVGKFREAAQS